jgi:hypothetical protein
MFEGDRERTGMQYEQLFLPGPAATIKNKKYQQKNQQKSVHIRHLLSNGKGNLGQNVRGVFSFPNMGGQTVFSLALSA